MTIAGLSFRTWTTLWRKGGKRRLSMRCRHNFVMMNARNAKRSVGIRRGRRSTQSRIWSMSEMMMMIVQGHRSYNSIRSQVIVLG